MEGIPFAVFLLIAGVVGLLALPTKGASVWQRPFARRFEYAFMFLTLVFAAWYAAAHWAGEASTWGSFSSVADARVFSTAQAALLFTLVISKAMQARWFSLRMPLVAANALVLAVFALIAGVSVDWASAQGFQAVALPFFWILCAVGLIGQIANSDAPRQMAAMAGGGGEVERRPSARLL